MFLSLKTDGPVRARARTAALRTAYVAVPAAAAFLLWTQLAHGQAWTWPLVALAALALVGGVAAARARREGLAFGLMVATILAAVVTLFGSLFPDVLPSTTDPAFSLTVENASSADYTLTIMTWVAVVFLPLVLLYQGWSYWVFRKRVTGEQITGATVDGGAEPEPEKVA